MSAPGFCLKSRIGSPKNAAGWEGVIAILPLYRYPLWDTATIKPRVWKNLHSLCSHDHLPSEAWQTSTSFPSKAAALGRSSRAGQAVVLVCSLLPGQVWRLQGELNLGLSHPLTCKFFKKSIAFTSSPIVLKKKSRGRRGKHLHLFQENAFCLCSSSDICQGTPFLNPDQAWSWTRQGVAPFGQASAHTQNNNFSLTENTKSKPWNTNRIFLVRKGDCHDHILWFK